MADESIDYVNRQDVIDQINREFSVCDTNYLATKASMAGELAELTQQVLGVQRSGNPLYRSEQIAAESNWLLHYTSDWNRLHRRLHALRLSLSASQQETEDQRTLLAGPDGAFGIGATEWFIRWNATTEAAQRNTYRPTPLLFLKPILSAGRLLAYLHKLQVSHIAETGSNLRAELASVESSMLQFLKKARLRKLLADPALWDDPSAEAINLSLTKMTESYMDFLDQTQHPRTGYWGPWYVISGELIKMHDLSYTFHIIHFRKGEIDRWDKVIDTTLEIGRLGLTYPYGWRPAEVKAKYSNHHNTDVATILQAGYKFAKAKQRREIAKAIRGMLDWCLTESLDYDKNGNPVGDFKHNDEIDVIDRYAFGIKFLDTVGYWSDDRFWWDARQEREATWPDFRLVGKNLLTAVRKLNSDSAYVDDIEKLLGRFAPAADTAMSSNTA